MNTHTKIRRTVRIVLLAITGVVLFSGLSVENVSALTGQTPGTKVKTARRDAAIRLWKKKCMSVKSNPVVETPVTAPPPITTGVINVVPPAAGGSRNGSSGDVPTRPGPDNPVRKDGPVVLEGGDPPVRRTTPIPRPKGVVDKGVLNGEAIFLPKPRYPATARAAHASGAVNVEVTVNENGCVISAVAISGPVLLRAPAVEAARGAGFLPTKLEGVPVEVTGTLIFNFTAR